MAFPNNPLITGFSTDGAVTTYTFGPNLATETIDFGVAFGGGQVVFDITFTEAVVDSGTPSTLLLLGTKTVALDTNPTYDFAVNTASFTLTDAGTDFNVLLSTDTFEDAGGGTIDGDPSSFSQTFQPLAVPAPGALVLLGLALPALAGRHRLCRRR